MNWTGGRLTRHSSSGNAANNRQKEHYARVQQRLRGGKVARSPIKWSILNHVVKETPEDRRHQSREFQSPKEHGPFLRRDAASPTSRPPTRRNGYNQRSKKSEEHSLQQDQAQAQMTNKRSLSPENEGAASTLRDSKRRKRDGSIENEDTAESARRRQLLRKGDWVGINILKPPRVEFTSPKRDGSIWKRRDVADKSRPLFKTRQTHVDSPFANRGRGRVVDNTTSQRQPNGMDVRISIGERIMPPGISSSTAISRTSRGSSRPVSSKYQPSISSDVMLLDEATNSPFIQRSGRHQTTNGLTNALRRSASVFSLESAMREIHTGSRERDQIYSHPTRDTFSEPSSPGGCLRYSQVPTSAAKSEIQSEIYAKSSSAPLQQPAPRTYKVSSLLRSDSSEIEKTTAGQIGLDSPIPHSQCLRNEVWRTWMSPCFGEKDAHEDTVGDNEPNVAISPGISVAIQNEQNLQSDNIDVDEQLQSEGSWAVGLEQFRSRINSRDVLVGFADVRDRTPVNQHNIQSRRSGGNDRTHPRDSYRVFSDQPVIKAAGLAHKPPNDPDELWRKFIFGSDDDDDSEPRAELSPGRTRDIDTIAPTIAQPTSTTDFTSSSPNIQSRAPRRALRVPCDTPSIGMDPSDSKHQKKSTQATHPRSENWHHDIPSSGTQMVLAETDLDSIGASMAVGSKSQSSNLPSENSTPLNLSKKQVVFTRPKPYGEWNRRSNGSFEEKPIYTGQNGREDGILDCTSKDLCRR